MSVLSDWLRNEWTKYAYTADAMGTRPAAWHVALFKADGAEITATEDDQYARQSTTFAMEATPPGRAKNADPVSFPAAMAGADYEVHFFGVYTDATAGELLVKKELEHSLNVTEGDVLSFNAGDLTVGAGVEN